jgi:hypothetical protein
MFCADFFPTKILLLRNVNAYKTDFGKLFSTIPDEALQQLRSFVPER